MKTKMGDLIVWYAPQLCVVALFVIAVITVVVGTRATLRARHHESEFKYVEILDEN